MDESRSYPLIIVMLMVACAGFGFMLGRQGATLPVQTEIIREVDTLYLRDTITRQRPQESHKGQTAETIKAPMPTTDTLWLHDTLYIELPREVRIYEDSLYRAEVSGYDPRLDRIDLYTREVVVSKTEITTKTEAITRPNRWGVGVQVGYGIGVRAGTVYTTPYVGVGLSWNILSW